MDKSSTSSATALAAEELFEDEDPSMIQSVTLRFTSGMMINLANMKIEGSNKLLKEKLALIRSTIVRPRRKSAVAPYDDLRL